MPIARPPDRPFAWQGWQLALPRRWDPVQLAGTAAAGHALFADGVRPRLGLRWHTPRRRVDIDAAVRRTLVAEVGLLAADEAAELDPPVGFDAAVLYAEPNPPGRDVWVGYSPLTDRVLCIAYHARRRDRVLANVVLPTLTEADPERASPWAVFDLSVVVPGDFALAGQRLNAGDLSLSFADRRGVAFTVRQIAVAELALRRLSLDGWVAEQQKSSAGRYRLLAAAVDVTVSTDGGEVYGRAARLTRRGRFALAVWHPRSLETVVVHDVGRDRLVVLHGADGDLLRTVAATVGVRPSAGQVVGGFTPGDTSAIVPA